MSSSDKEDRARALRAVLDMIDSEEFELESKEDREAALNHIIELKNLTSWAGSGKYRQRVSYPMWKLSDQVGQLANQLMEGVKETTPKTAIIWQSGTSVIKPEYLKKYLNYEIALRPGNASQNTRAQSPAQRKHKIVPKVCIGIPGSDDCEKDLAKALYHTGGGYCCEPCLDLAIDEDGHMKRVGGCSNPHKNSKCKHLEVDDPVFYKDHILCKPCKAVFLQEEKNKSSSASATTPSEDDASDDEYARGPKLLPNNAERDQATDIIVTASSSIIPSTETSTKKRAAETPPCNPAQVQHKRPREAFHDELHLTGDTGIAASQAQYEMDTILAALRETINFLHFDIKADPSGPASLLENDDNEMSSSLRHLYDSVVGTDRAQIFMMLQDKTLTSYDMMLGLFGAFLHQRLFTQELQIPCMTWPASTVYALQAELGKSDAEMHKLRAFVAYREVTSKDFGDNFVANTANSIAESMSKIMLPHIQLAARGANAGNPIRTSSWLPSLQENLAKALKRALNLKARLQVAPVQYQMTWFQSGSDFDEATMQELNEVGRKDNRKLAMTLLPGCMCGEEVITKAVVSLDVMIGETA